MILLQLPVSAKFAEGQFKIMECVRQVNGSVSTDSVKVLEQANDLDKLIKMLDSAIVGKKTAKLLKEVGQIGVILSFE